MLEAAAAPARLYVGLDLSKSTAALCAMDDDEVIVRRATVPMEIPALVKSFDALPGHVARVVFEAGCQSFWLYDGLIEAGLPAVCLEARSVKNYLKERRSHKTDRNDALGLAELARVKFYNPVHVRSHHSRNIISAMGGRATLLRSKLRLAGHVRGVLRSRGHLLGRTTEKFSSEVEACIQNDPALTALVQPMLSACGALDEHFRKVDKEVKAMADADPVCVRLRTVPGVGPLTSLAVRAAVDSPGRLNRPRDAGPLLGLVPCFDDSGDIHRYGKISRRGSRLARTHLVQAAHVVMSSRSPDSPLKRWANELAMRSHRNTAAVALARRLAVIMVAIWMNGTDFEPSLLDI